MSVLSGLRSRALGVLLGRRAQRLRHAYQEAKRRLLRRPRVVSAFLQLDDPYSYLLAHYLPALAESYDIELRLYLSEARGGAYRPEPEMQAEYGVMDCTRLAAELGVPFLDQGTAPPVEYRRSMLEALASLAGTSDFDSELPRALAVYWRGDAEAASRLGAPDTGRAEIVIDRARKMQRQLGHYNSATVHYAGDWYWGVDRLHYLLDSLDDLGAAKGASIAHSLVSLRQATQITLPVAPPAAARDLPALELFHSIRSPYSYLALQRTYDIADAFGLQLKLRPVLPMVMRGMQVPKHKLLYIARDAIREAASRGIAFGKFADPVGAGTERALAVFCYAESEKRGRDFLLNAGEAIWSQAVDVATDAGMRKVTGRTGLFWPDVLAAMESDAWRTRIEANRASMMASGSWGVPTLRMGDFVAWGQDRDWLLVRHIEELCDSGDGILV